MQIISSLTDLVTYIANANPANVGDGKTGAVAEALANAEGRPAWGEDWSAYLEQYAAPIALVVTAKFEPDAHENIRETGCDPVADVVRLVSGAVSSEALLEECLNGADDDRIPGWRSYVSTIENCASV